MTLAQFATLFNRSVNDLERDMPKLLAGMANDTIALVQERIQTKGMSANGARLKAYTIAYEKFKKNPRKYKRGQELGLASSRFTGVTDYTLTGRMWADIRVLRLDSNGSSIRAIVGASKSENISKLKALKKRDGVNPLMPTEQEIQIGKENLKANILSYFNYIQ